MASRGLRCILHIGKKTTEPVKNIDENSWKKIQKADKSRKSLWGESKFHKLVLPPVFDDTTGYHSSCYKDFTAVPQYCQGEPESKQTDPESHILRKDVEHSVCDRRGIFEPLCLFCGQKTKSTKNKKGNREYLQNIEVKQTEDSIKDAANKLGDQVLLAKIGSVDLIAKEAKVHHSCRRTYINKANRSTEDSQKVTTSQHDIALESVKSYVKYNLIDNKDAIKLQVLYGIYLDVLENEETSYTAQKLCQSLMKEFSNDIKTLKRSNKEGLILYHTSLSEDDAVLKANSDGDSVARVAFFLRTLLLKDEKVDLPDPLTVESIKNGEAVIPPQLRQFFKVLYTGSSHQEESERITRMVQSACDDAIFIVSRGKIRPGKHLCLGLGLKSITGSRCVVEVMNRFGHSINYHLAEEIETEIATQIADRNNATPDGIDQIPGLLTALAWDNYDEQNETTSGFGTLHDTVGICYQNIPNKDNDETNPPGGVTTGEETRKKRPGKRSLTVEEKELEPYRKKPKIAEFHYEVQSQIEPPHTQLVKERDIFWTLNLALLKDIPMWYGWNSSLTDDPLPKQRIGYMENISLPSTRLDVVVETLKQSQRVKNECREQFIIVHYDLNIAKPAMQIQAAEAPKYDDIFICFGPFHILMAYFGSMGYLLDGSGGPEILTENSVLAPGSLNGFLNGKHFNRCKRLHPMLAAAFRVLHIKAFLEVNGPLPESLKTKMQSLQKEPSPELMQEIERCDEYQSFMNAYSEYKEDTLSGKYGSTAQFWMIYIHLIDTYLRFNRASRTNDFELFVFSLGEMIPIFFATSRNNYSKWMVRYHLNLLNIDSTHPGVKETLASGALSVRRSDKSFSRTFVDQTLEAQCSTGIAAFSTSDSARRRWMLTKAARSGIVGSLLEKAGLKTKEDVSKSLKPYRKKKDNDDLQKLIDGIQNTMNPFQQLPEPYLYCITSGKEVDESVKEDLLNCREKGETWQKEYVSGCFKDDARFEQPVPRRKVKNFASQALKTKVTCKDKKIVELQGTRDLFGRLLYISTVENIDLAKVFTYPLTPVPFSLAQIDGSPNKTDKSTLMHKLEKFADSTAPVSVDVVFIDAMFVLHYLQDLPVTFGEISSMILKHICSMAHEVHFIADTYQSPSIKQDERMRRGMETSAYSITGRNQKRPQSWQTSLRSPAFKTAFLNFLVKHWEDDENARTISDHTVYLATENQCYQYTSIEGKVRCSVSEMYACKHEEADTKIIYHLRKACDHSPNSNYVVRSNDTDVLVLLLYHSSHFRSTPNVWMDAGLSGNNTRRYINISQLVQVMEPEFLDALPGLHAFTGSDFTASFMNKGKLKPLNVMMKSKSHTEAMSKLGEDDEASIDLKTSVEKFVCVLYAHPRLCNVNDVRHALFQRKYAPRKDIDPLKVIKGINPSSMPPCKKVLENKLKRANYVTGIWKKADTESPTTCSPIGNGWNLENNQYTINWYDGDQLPRALCDVLEEPTDSEDSETEEEACTDSDDACDSD